MRRLYIYYRVEAAHAAQALPAQQAMLQEACARFAGLQAELLRRPQEKDGLQTWMEVYVHPDGVSNEVESWVLDPARRLSLGQALDNLYVESFVPCAS